MKFSSVNVLIKRQNSLNWGRTCFKQCTSCNNGVQLQEFNIAVGFVVKGFMCSSKGESLNGIFRTRKYFKYRNRDSPSYLCYMSQITSLTTGNVVIAPTPGKQASNIF